MSHRSASLLNSSLWEKQGVKGHRGDLWLQSFSLWSLLWNLRARQCRKSSWPDVSHIRRELQMCVLRVFSLFWISQHCLVIRETSNLANKTRGSRLNSGETRWKLSSGRSILNASTPTVRSESPLPRMQRRLRHRAPPLTGGEFTLIFFPSDSSKNNVYLLSQHRGGERSQTHSLSGDHFMLYTD